MLYLTKYYIMKKYYYDKPSKPTVKPGTKPKTAPNPHRRAIPRKNPSTSPKPKA